jgi:hypothetical protein
VVVIYRWIRGRQLRRQLQLLPADRLSRVLVSLARETGNTRRIVAPLLDQFDAPTELTPANAPQGSGDALLPAPRCLPDGTPADRGTA